jgi:CRP-like cAMP-binding protein
VTPAELARHADRLLTAHALPAGDPGVVASLLSRCAVRRVNTGEHLFRAGEPASELIFLLEGRARVFKIDHTGRDREIGSWYPPSVLGALAVVDGAPRSATCMIGAPSLIAALSPEATKRLLGEASPEGAHLRWLLLATAAETLSDTTAHLREALAAAPTTGGAGLDRLHALIERAQS